MRKTLPLVAVGTALCLASACAEVSESTDKAAGVTIMQDANTDAIEPGRAATAVPAADLPATASALSTLLVSGIFDAPGEELLRLYPAVVIPGQAREPTELARGFFTLEVTYLDGSTAKVPFDALIASDPDLDIVEHGFFEVALQLEGEIDTVRILGAGDLATFAEISGAEISG